MMMLTKYFSRLLVCAFMILTQKAFAQSGHRDSIETLLRQSSRPTVVEFVEAMNKKYGENWPSRNPFYDGGRITSASAAKLVASMERAYPGGLYLSLGRDVALVGDLLEAGYRTLGQNDRVKRLDASGPSFPHYYNGDESTFKKDRQLLFDFLRTNGLNLDNVANEYPYIIFDVTSWRPQSQSRQLLRSVYQTYEAAGKNVKDLFSKVNFVGISMGSLNPREITPSFDLRKYEAQEKAQVTSEGPEAPLYLKHEFVSNLTYTPGWHPMFQSFTRLSDGRVVTSFDKIIPYTTERRKILGELFDVIQAVRSPEFKTNVKKAAAELGYEFPEGRTETLTFLPADQIPKPELFGGYNSSSHSWWNSEPITFNPPEVKPPAEKPAEKPVDNPKEKPVTVDPGTPPDEMSYYLKKVSVRIGKSPYFSEVVFWLEDLAGMVARQSASSEHVVQFVDILRTKNLLSNTYLLNMLASSVVKYPVLEGPFLGALFPKELEHFQKILIERKRIDHCIAILDPGNKTP